MITCKPSVIPYIPFGCDCNSGTCVHVQDGDVSQMQFILSPVSPNLITNGTFGSSTGWTVGPDWDISGGVASCSADILSPDVLSRDLDSEIVDGYYMVQVDLNPSGAMTLNMLIGSVPVFAASGSLGEDQTIKYFTFIEGASSNLLEIYGSGNFTIDNLIIYRLSEPSFEIQVCENEVEIFTGTDAEYFETAEINLNTDNFITENATGQGQLTIEWAELGIDYDCYCVCIKDNALLSTNLVRNGIFSNTSFWTITNDGALGWEITLGYAEHSSGGVETGADILSQTLASPLDASKTYNLTFDVAFGTGSTNADLTVLYDTATLTNQVLDTFTVTGSATKTYTLTNLAITKIKFSADNAGIRKIQVDNVAILQDEADCTCRTICVNYKEEQFMADACNILIKASDNGNVLGYNFSDFDFEHQLRVFGKLRFPKYDYTNEEIYKHSNGEKELVSTGYEKYSELQIYQVPEALTDIISLLIIHHNLSLTIDGSEFEIVKRPGSLQPVWTRITPDAPMVIEVCGKTQNFYNYLV